VVEKPSGRRNTSGTEVASRAAPDGNTLLITTPEFVINAHLRKLSYDPLSSFEPICYLVRSPQLIVVNSASPYRTLTDLLNSARAKPGELTLASAGPASSTAHRVRDAQARGRRQHQLHSLSGLDARCERAAGRASDIGDASYPNVAELVQTGKLRAIATASSARIDPMPDVPTVAESGFKDFEAGHLVWCRRSAKTPNETIAQLTGWFVAAIEVPEIKTKLAAQGLFPVGTCGAAFGAFTRKQYDDYGRAIREANIKAQ
jgi:tripartite-type tricarboxylate transporter receptor subunit TctC